MLAVPPPAMYIHRMVRTQLYLDETLHRRLGRLAAQQGRTVSELVREAIARAYGADSADRLTTLDGITGLWEHRADLGDTRAYVKRLRKDTRRKRRRP
jgi:predicted transcriptional regulator